MEKTEISVDWRYAHLKRVLILCPIEGVKKI